MKAIHSAAPVVYLTGPPGAGKTTIAALVHDELRARGRPVLWLDSDDLRRVLTPNPRYDEPERDWFYASIAHLAALGARGGTLVLISATAHRRRYRDTARSGVERFMEVHVRCPLARLRARDPKGLYERAGSGELDQLPGIGTPFEPPLEPELEVSTDEESPEQSAAHVMRELGRRFEDWSLG